MSIFGQPPGQSTSNANSPSSNPVSGQASTPASIYGRGDLQAAFNWLVNQPEHVRKQASDPDRLMTLYYRSSGRPEMARPEPRHDSRSDARIENDAPVSSQNFISDLRQINEAMRQFDGPGANATLHSPTHTSTHPVINGTSHVAPPPHPSVPLPSAPLNGAQQKSQAMLQEVREKLNLSSESEALNVLISIGYRSLKPILG